MSRAQPMEKKRPPVTRTLISLHAHEDGRISIVATGNGQSLTLQVGQDKRAPSISMLDDHLSPMASWRLEANGKLKGWIKQHQGKVLWLRPDAKRAASMRTTKPRPPRRSARKEG